MNKGMIFFALVLLSISCISAATIFPASNVSIKIDGTDRTLQYAIDNSLLTGTHTYASADVSNIVGQHDASQVWVRVSTGEITLLNALTTAGRLIPASTATASYSGTVPNPGHSAMEITLSSGQTFQNAIDNGNLVACTPGTSKKCGTDNACTTYPTITCTSLGAWPTCTPTYATFGTQSTCPSDQTCDATGNCLSYTGTGCSACPFGTETTGTSPDTNTFCINKYSTGGSWPTTYTYQGISLSITAGSSNTVWTTTADTYQFECSQSRYCNNYYSGVCTCNDGCSESAKITNYGWKMRPYNSISTR
jgi:hypothetical protein